MRNLALAQAIRQVPRAAFASETGLVAGRSIPAVPVVREVLDALDLDPGTRMLHVGSGVGYVAAVASRVAMEVDGIDRLPPMVELAQAKLDALGYRNVHFRAGEGEDGWPERAPFDAILVSATADEVPPALRRQLAIGGRLVATLGADRSRLRLVRARRISAEQFVDEELGEISLAPSLVEILLADRVLSASDVELARQRAKESGRSELDELRDLRGIEEIDLYRALAQQHGMRLGDVSELLTRIDLEVFARVPRAYLDHHRMIPVCQEGDRILVATTEPRAALDDVQKAFPKTALELVLVTPTDHRRLWAAFELRQSGRQLRDPRSKGPVEIADLLEVDASVLEAHAVTIFQALVLDAIGERASDIHLECYGDRVRVRLRVDGELRDLPRYRMSQPELAGLVNVIKVRANLDIAEKRLPQGGRMRLRAGDAVYDLRVQTQPTLYAENVVIRLLPQDTHLLTVEDLGFPSEVANQYRRLLRSPAGLILVVGPTGSGKSTTLYAGLQILAADTTRKVITVEDPVEYSIAGIQQTQVKPDIGFRFADAMRSFVRQDPDVIFVGEIRDQETALEAIRASQTGHVVLSTLHCNDAVDAVQRLFDLGMHANSIASELLTVIAQRLGKRICTGCRRPAVGDPLILAELFPRGVPADFTCFEGAGCERCDGHGNRGRVAVIEFLPAGPQLRAAISRRLPLDELREVALACGLHSLRDSAVELVRQGVIALPELPRMLPAERMAG